MNGGPCKCYKGNLKRNNSGFSVAKQGGESMGWKKEQIEEEERKPDCGLLCSKGR